MPRSHSSFSRWHALAASVAFVVFVSLMIVEAGAQGSRRSRSSTLQQNYSTSNTRPQVRRKSIASLRSTETSDGSRVTITSDVPLNDYAAYWSGDRYYVVIPEADLVTQNVSSLQNSLRGRGFQDVKIEKRGNDVVLSFRLRPGMRARVEQKFNRLDIVFAAPGAVSSYPNQTGTGQTGTGQTGTGQTRTGPRTPGEIITSTQTSNTGGATQTGTGPIASTGSGAGTRGGRGRRGGGGGYGGYGIYRGGGGGGGAPLNIPLPSEMALPQATPSGSPPASAAGSPPVSTSATPPQIAQAQSPQQTGGVPPVTSTKTPTLPSAPATDTSFAAAVRNNWLPLLIGLLVLLAIGLLLVSRSRSRGEEAPPTGRIETGKKGKLKGTTPSKMGAALAGAAAGAAAAKAKEAAKKPAPAKETVEKDKVKTKDIQVVAPSVSSERVGAEVKGLLEGGKYDEAVIASTNPETRQLVSTELQAALASRNPERRERAREAYSKHGFFDEATQNLRTAKNPAERISAARSLALTENRAATPHLTAALEDNDPEVRRAAVNALAEMRDPSAIGPLNALLQREKNRKVPHSLIRRAIEASATIDVAESPRATASAPTAAAESPATKAVEAQDKAGASEGKDKDDDDREVFEI